MPSCKQLVEVGSVTRNFPKRVVSREVREADEKPDTAAGFLSKRGYDWPNFHDDNGEIQKLMGSTPIPRLVLIDSQGKIAYDAVGPTGDELRAAIAKLGREYEFLSPKPKQAPCVASK
jgi:hypothetical protein